MSVYSGKWYLIRLHGRIGRARPSNKISTPMDHLPASPIERPLYIGGSVINLTPEAALWDALDDISIREKVSVEDIISSATDRWDREEVASLLWQHTVTYCTDAFRGFTKTMPKPACCLHSV
jgi:predicted DNA-binding ribbon-helix-helix protein